jgi:glycosyltransferase involved in cell wall biosynthesis
MKLVIDWGVSAFFGWGVYGLNLALELSRDPTVEARCPGPIDPRQIGVDALRIRALGPFLARSSQGAPASDAAWLHALGNEFMGERPPGARVGVIFFEAPLSSAAIERAKGYDLIITGSSWNEEVLNAHGITKTRTILQGVDRSLFFPAPKRNLFPDRFLIFSGGKAEPRKGQDIVVTAFRIFAQRHPEAMLVTAWHSPWPQLAQGMDLDLSRFADRVIDAGQLPNGLMAPVYRECDVALFTNRAEGGTNLVAMECLACGVPTILSGNTGHRDLLRMGLGTRLSQKPSAFWSEWGESDVEEVVEALEVALRNRNAPRKITGLPQWSDLTRDLLEVVRNAYEDTSAIR